MLMPYIVHMTNDNTDSTEYVLQCQVERTSIGLKLGRRVAMVNAVPSNNADTYWGSVSCDVMGGAIMRT